MHDIGFVDKIADEEEFRDLLNSYYGEVLKGFAAAGGPALSAEVQADKSIQNNADYLPPRGRTALVRDTGGRLIGCGSLRRIDDDAVEMKRMFVRPEAQGQGIGRRLFDIRIEEARRMQARAIYADTFKGNRSMLKIYESYGFTYIDRYDGNANPEEWAPLLVFLEYRLE